MFVSWLAGWLVFIYCIFGFIESHYYVLYIYSLDYIFVQNAQNRLRFDSIWFRILYANGKKHLVWFIQTTWVMHRVRTQIHSILMKTDTHTVRFDRMWMCCLFCFGMASYFYYIICVSSHCRQAHLRLRISNLNIDCFPDHKINNNKRPSEWVNERAMERWISNGLKHAQTMTQNEQIVHSSHIINKSKWLENEDSPELKLHILHVPKNGNGLRSLPSSWRSSSSS